MLKIFTVHGPGNDQGIVAARDEEEAKFLFQQAVKPCYQDCPLLSSFCAVHLQIPSEPGVMWYA